MEGNKLRNVIAGFAGTTHTKGIGITMRSTKFYIGKLLDIVYYY